MSDRKRGIRVSATTKDELSTNANVPAQLAELFTDFGVVALATNKSGEDFYLCSEGVGWKAKVAHASWLTVDLGTEDLADFIRTFGSRLDSNHYQWFYRLSE